MLIDDERDGLSAKGRKKLEWYFYVSREFNFISFLYFWSELRWNLSPARFSFICFAFCVILSEIRLWVTPTERIHRKQNALNSLRTLWSPPELHVHHGWWCYFTLVFLIPGSCVINWNAGSGESWYRSSLSFTNSFPYEHECLPKADQRAFYQIYWITLKSAWWVT